MAPEAMAQRRNARRYTVSSPQAKNTTSKDSTFARKRGSDNIGVHILSKTFFGDQNISNTSYLFTIHLNSMHCAGTSEPHMAESFSAWIISHLSDANFAGCSDYCSTLLSNSLLGCSFSWSRKLLPGSRFATRYSTISWSRYSIRNIRYFASLTRQYRDRLGAIDITM